MDIIEKVFCSTAFIVVCLIPVVMVLYYVYFGSRRPDDARQGDVQTDETVSNRSKEEFRNTTREEQRQQSIAPKPSNVNAPIKIDITRNEKANKPPTLYRGLEFEAISHRKPERTIIDVLSSRDNLDKSIAGIDITADQALRADKESTASMSGCAQSYTQRMKETYPRDASKWTELQRFHVELFQEPNFVKPITSLKDAPEQNLSVLVRRPIRSIRIHTLPNDVWRFTQSFSVVIYLQHDPSYRVVFRVPEKAAGQEHFVKDTDTNEELLGWMSNWDTKVVVFTVGNYNPLVDLYDESLYHRRLPYTPKSVTTTDHLDAETKYTWINIDKPDFWASECT